jgi:hypothetical protein
MKDESAGLALIMALFSVATVSPWPISSPPQLVHLLLKLISAPGSQS